MMTQDNLKPHPALPLVAETVQVMERAGATVDIAQEANAVTVTVEYQGERYVVRSDDLLHAVSTAALRAGIKVKFE